MIKVLDTEFVTHSSYGTFEPRYNMLVRITDITENGDIENEYKVQARVNFLDPFCIELQFVELLNSYDNNEYTLEEEDILYLLNEESQL